jgi:hypothetical protein
MLPTRSGQNTLKVLSVAGAALGLRSNNVDAVVDTVNQWQLTAFAATWAVYAGLVTITKSFPAEQKSAAKEYVAIQTDLGSLGTSAPAQLRSAEAPVVMQVARWIFDELLRSVTDNRGAHSAHLHCAVVHFAVRSALLGTADFADVMALITALLGVGHHHANLLGHGDDAAASQCRMPPIDLIPLTAWGRVLGVLTPILASTSWARRSACNFARLPLLQELHPENVHRVFSERLLRCCKRFEDAHPHFELHARHINVTESGWEKVLTTQPSVPSRSLLIPPKPSAYYLLPRTAVSSTFVASAHNRSTSIYAIQAADGAKLFFAHVRCRCAECDPTSAEGASKFLGSNVPLRYEQLSKAAIPAPLCCAEYARNLILDNRWLVDGSTVVVSHLLSARAQWKSDTHRTRLTWCGTDAHSLSDDAILLVLTDSSWDGVLRQPRYLGAFAEAEVKRVVQHARTNLLTKDDMQVVQQRVASELCLGFSQTVQQLVACQAAVASRCAVFASFQGSADGHLCFPAAAVAVPWTLDACKAITASSVIHPICAPILNAETPTVFLSPTCCIVQSASINLVCGSWRCSTVAFDREPFARWWWKPFLNAHIPRRCVTAVPPQNWLDWL